MFVEVELPNLFVLTPNPGVGLVSLDFLTSEIYKYDPGPGVVSSMYSYSSSSESSSILVEGGALSEKTLL